MEELTINKSFAKKYDKYRKAEELQKLKARYGVDPENSESSSTESEDEKAEAVNKQLETDFFKTIACLKRKDPIIYDKEKSFFKNTSGSSTNSDEESDNNSKDAEKPVYLKDYERNVIIKHAGVYANEDFHHTAVGSYNGELNEIKKSLLEATTTHETNEDSGDLLQPKFISEGKQAIQSTLEELDDYWKDTNLPEDETFLRDYILQHKYLDKDQYDSGSTDAEYSDDDRGGEMFVKKQETFERKYNFRYEEPDAEFIKSYPRTIGDSVRRSDNKTKKKREEKNLRKEEKMRKKTEELKRLKQLKREEILEKINKLQEATGNSDIRFSTQDLEGDFDADDYDRRMKALFDENFYDDADIQKPEFSDLEEDVEPDWDEFPCSNVDGVSNGDYIPDCEQPEFNMDCDYEPEGRPHRRNPETNNKRKKRSAFFDAVAKKKPLFDPNTGSFDQYLEEYYALDFEDVIGDMPCRFKYRKVVPQSYGLSADEILSSDNRTLNSWCSLKRVVCHSSAHDEASVSRKFARKARLKKKRHFQTNTKDDPSGKGEKTEVTEVPVKKTKLNSKQRRRKREREQRLRALSTTLTNANDRSNAVRGKKRLQRSKRENADLKKVSKIDAERLKAYGIKPKKILNKLKYGKPPTSNSA